MSIEMPKTAAAHIKADGEIKKTYDDGSSKFVEDYNELDELNDYDDEHKRRAIYHKDIKKESINYDRKRGGAKASKPKRKDYRLN